MRIRFQIHCFRDLLHVRAEQALLGGVAAVGQAGRLLLRGLAVPPRRIDAHVADLVARHLRAAGNGRQGLPSVSISNSILQTYWQRNALCRPASMFTTVAVTTDPQQRLLDADYCH